MLRLFCGVQGWRTDDYILHIIFNFRCVHSLYVCYIFVKEKGEKMTQLNHDESSDRECTREEINKLTLELNAEIYADFTNYTPIEWSTGAWNGPLITLDPDDPFGDMERIFNRGIHVTSITPPEQGWPIATYCPICKKTTFVLSPWAIKPKDGDYFKMNDVCGDDTLGFEHNMRLGMKMPSSHRKCL